MRLQRLGIGSILSVAVFATVAAASPLDCREWRTRALDAESTATGIGRCLEEGIDPDHRDEDGWTLLHSATRYYGEYPDGQARKFQALVSGGADPNAQDKAGLTPLHQAVRHTHATLGWRPAVIKALLGAGADPAVKNTDGKVPWDFVEDPDELKDYE